jgi:hypothetical protein
MLFPAYPMIFEEVHGLNAGLGGCAFLSIIVGCVLSVPVSLHFNKGYLRAVAANGGIHAPEFRLPMGLLGGIIFALSILWLGWSGYRATTSIWVPIASGVFTGLGATLVFRAFQTYLIDFYKRYAASALGTPCLSFELAGSHGACLAAGLVMRSVFGAILPLFVEPMFRRLGIEWACTLYVPGSPSECVLKHKQASVSDALSGPGTTAVHAVRRCMARAFADRVLLHRYGPLLRQKSKFGSPDEEAPTPLSKDPEKG